LARLKKRPQAKSEADIGTNEDVERRKAEAAKASKGRMTPARVQGLVMTREQMEKHDYVVQVPDGPGGDRPTEEGNAMVCDRCKQSFVVKGTLSEVWTPLPNILSMTSLILTPAFVGNERQNAKHVIATQVA
jgi:RNA exonuclease 1